MNPKKLTLFFLWNWCRILKEFAYFQNYHARNREKRLQQQREYRANNFAPDFPPLAFYLTETVLSLLESATSVDAG